MMMQRTRIHAQTLSELNHCVGTARRDAASAGVLAFLAGKRADFVRVHSVGPAREAMRAYLHCADGPSKQQERD